MAKIIFDGEEGERKCQQSVNWDDNAELTPRIFVDIPLFLLYKELLPVPLSYKHSPNNIHSPLCFYVLCCHFQLADVAGT